MIGTIVKLEGAQALLERLVERPERLKIFTSVQFYRELVIVYTNFNDVLKVYQQMYNEFKCLVWELFKLRYNIKILWNW